MTRANAKIQLSNTQVKAGVVAFGLALSIGVAASAQQADPGLDLKPYHPYQGSFQTSPNQPGASYQGNPYIPNIAGAVQQAASANQNPVQPGVSYQSANDGAYGRRRNHQQNNQEDNRADNQPYQPGLSYMGGVPYGSGANGGNANGGSQPDNRADNQPDQAGLGVPPGIPYSGGPNGGGANGGEPPMRADNQPDQAGVGLPPGIPFAGGPSGGGPHRPFNPLPPHGPAIPKPGYDTSWSFPPAPPKPCPQSAPPPAPTPPPPIIPGDPSTTLRNPYIEGEQVTPANQAPALGQPEVPGNGDNWFGVNPGMLGAPIAPASAVYIPPMGAYDKDEVNAMVQPYLTPPPSTPGPDPGMLPGPGGLQNPSLAPPASWVYINADGNPTMPGDQAPRERWNAQTTRDLGSTKTYGSQLTDFGQNPALLNGRANWSISQDGPRPFVFPGAIDATSNRNPNMPGAQVTQDLNGNRTLFKGSANDQRAQMTLIPTPPATH